MYQTYEITDLLCSILIPFVSDDNKHRVSDRNLIVNVLGHFQQALTDVHSLIDSSLCGNGLTIWHYIN